MPNWQQVWRQHDIPVVIRRRHAKIRVRLPYADNNRQWLRNDRRTEPEWNPGKRCWELPQAWFNNLVNQAIQRWGKVWVIQPHNVMEKCAPACQNAQGHVCECSCMGENHGAGNDGSWFEVDETFAFRWQNLGMAAKLLKENT